MSDIDLEKYRRHVAHLDMPEERKTELLRAVWHIMQSFVDRAFGDDPVQQALRAGDKSDTKDAPAEKTMLESPDPSQQTARLSCVFQSTTEKSRRRRNLL